MRKNGQPKVLFFDIESAGVNAFKSDLGFVICFGYMWQGEKRAHCLTIDLSRTRDKFSDKELLEQASEIFNQADIIVAHYGSIFDRRFLQGRLLINGLPPIAPTRMRDTCMMARSIANFSSNRLKHLCKILNLDHQKLENGWPQAWMDVLAGDQKALKRLAKYCQGDVVALAELYERLKIFDTAHPRLVLDRAKCGLCGSAVEYRGYGYKLTAKYRRYVCTNPACRKWGMEGTAVKEEKVLRKAA